MHKTYTIGDRSFVLDRDLPQALHLFPAEPDLRALSTPIAR